MSNKPILEFWNAKHLGEAGSLEVILEKINAMFHQIRYVHVGNHVSGLFADWPIYNQKVLDEIDIAYQKQHLKFLASDSQKSEYNHLMLRFELSWKQDKANKLSQQNLHIHAAYSSSLFTQKRFHWEFYAQKFLEVGIQMYNILQPEFGCIELCSPRGRTNLKDISKLEIPHIYWANFFSPDYVQKFGEEFLLGAPCWKKEILNDNGVVLVLSPHMGTQMANNSNFEKIKEYFSVKSIRCQNK